MRTLLQEIEEYRLTAHPTDSTFLQRVQEALESALGEKDKIQAYSRDEIARLTRQRDDLQTEVGELRAELKKEKDHHLHLPNLPGHKAKAPKGGK